MKHFFKFHLITYGCQMNKSDSERIAGFLESLGGQAVAGPEEADLVILNTCSVRQSAEDRVFGQVHNLVNLKKTRPDLIIAVTGCLPGRDKDGSLKKKIPGLDLYFPIIDLPKLPEMLAVSCPPPTFTPTVTSGKRRYPERTEGFSPPPTPSFVRRGQAQAGDYLSITPRYQNHFSAFVPIQTGCNNFCSYCVVPYARGPERNRPLRDILREIRDLAGRGYLEITLLGQTVNSYCAPDPEIFSPANPFYPLLIKGGLPNHFAALLWEVNQIEGLNRIHFTAPDPQFMSDEVIEALTLPKQVNYLHLPVQSGSNKILKKMNRRYTREDYLEIIRRIRECQPSIALGTDIMVGFPGESEADFSQTIDLYKEADFDIAYLAQYSPRSGTAAFKLKDDISPAEKENRWWILQKLMEETTLRKNQTYLGRTVEVLVEKKKSGKTSLPVIPPDVSSGGIQRLYSGQSREMKLVEFESDTNRTGQLVKVKIEKAERWRLIGKT